MTPHEMTADECRAAFLTHLLFVARSHAHNSKDKEEAVELTVFSILTLIDGESGLPAFGLYPMPAAEDKAFRQEKGENWWPEEDCDISDGELHSRWAQKKW